MDYFTFNGWEWDITVAGALVAARQTTRWIATRDAARHVVHDPLAGPDPSPGEFPPPDVAMQIVIDKRRALRHTRVDPRVPGIAIHFPGAPEDAGLFLIDGWHRAYRAYRTGRLRFAVHLLSPGEEARIRLATGDWSWPRADDP
jgi:hypothetical protein